MTVAIINPEKSGNNESNPIIAMNRRSLKKKNEAQFDTDNLFSISTNSDERLKSTL